MASSRIRAGLRTSSTAAGASSSTAARRATSSRSTRRWTPARCCSAGGPTRALPTPGPQRDGEFADKFNSMPKYVVSSTLTDPEWNNSTVIDGRPRRRGREAAGRGRRRHRRPRQRPARSGAARGRTRRRAAADGLPGRARRAASACSARRATRSRWSWPTRRPSATASRSWSTSRRPLIIVAGSLRVEPVPRRLPGRLPRGRRGRPRGGRLPRLRALARPARAGPHQRLRALGVGLSPRAFRGSGPPTTSSPNSARSTSASTRSPRPRRDPEAASQSRRRPTGPPPERRPLERELADRLGQLLGRVRHRRVADAADVAELCAGDQPLETAALARQQDQVERPPQDQDGHIERRQPARLRVEDVREGVIEAGAVANSSVCSANRRGPSSTRARRKGPRRAPVRPDSP